MRPEDFHAIFQCGAWSELHAGSAPRRLLRIWIRCLALWFHHHQPLRFWPTVTFALLWHLLLLTKAHIQLQFSPAYVCVRACVALGSMWVRGWWVVGLLVVGALGRFCGWPPGFPSCIINALRCCSWVYFSLSGAAKIGKASNDGVTECKCECEPIGVG